MKHAAVILLLGLAFITRAFAQVPLTYPDRSQKTYIAPAFFGPNAFPVPLMNAGCVAKNIAAELAGEYANGFMVEGAEDRTADVFVKLSIPIIADKVAVSFWMPFEEWWSYDETVAAARRVQTPSGKPYSSGDLYMSLDYVFLKEGKKVPSVVSRTVLKTASARRGFPDARNYDSPGYFFDLTAGKTVISSDSGLLRELRLAASTGFLCWQTDNGRQNDAVMYGVQAIARTANALLDLQFSGYSGWEKCGDEPMTLSARLTALPGCRVQPLLQLRHGLRDWPFTQYSAGVRIEMRR